ncbi:MAG: DUF2726 domain-containing protein [Telluria sp.]
MNSPFLLLILVVLVAGSVLALLRSSHGKNRAGTYKQRALMTDNEAEFFGRLVVALPDHYIFPQVAMSALLDTTSSDKRTAHSDRLRIAQQRIDYLVCTKRCEVVAVVELDDKTHSRAKDQLRDTRLEQAGIRTVRFHSRSKPAVDAIRATILGSAPAEFKTAPHAMPDQGVAQK